MSDASGAATPDEEYRSDIDPAFSAVWNDIFGEEDNPETAEGGAAAGTPESGDPASAPAQQGTGGDATPADAPTAGALAGAADPNGSAGLAAGNGSDGSTDAGSAETAAASVVAQESLKSYAEVAPSFATANDAITARMEESFRQSAEQELRTEVDEKYFTSLEKHPMALVGETVPSIKGDGQNMVLRDTQEARDWQEATKSLIDGEIAAKVRARTDEVRPMMNVIQESILMLQNNSDLIPGTKEYDSELADQFTTLAKAYELRVGDKLYGYQVNVQPLINELRTRLASQRGASGEQANQAAREAQQRRAAEQSRNQQGQFDAPQAGISSKANVSGDSGDDDFSGFWSGVGMPNVSI